VRLILASQSPRRLALLAQIGIVPDAVYPACLSEAPLPQESPGALARRLAKAKALWVKEAVLTAELASCPLQERPQYHPQELQGAAILAADTVVAVGQRIMGNPQDAGQAQMFLERLSGRRHRVYSAVCLIAPDGRLWQRQSLSQVSFKRLTAQEISDYILSQEWQGKAGGYAVQGLAAAFVKSLSGSYSGVVGLPLYETAGLLHKLQIKIGKAAPSL
jgi:septum formation protein